MKTETLIKKIIFAVENDKPTTLTINGKKFHITKTMINTYKNAPLKEINEKRLKKIDDRKEGGILPLLPLIFGGIAAAGAVAGGAAGITKAVQDKQAKDKEALETARHNKEIETYMKQGSALKNTPLEHSDLKLGDGVIDDLKDVGKKTLKNLLKDLGDKIIVEKKGDGLYIRPYIQGSGSGLYLNPWKP